MQLFYIIYYAMAISKQIYSNSNNIDTNINTNINTNTIYNNTYTKNNNTPSYESPYDYKYFALLLLH